LITYIYSGSHLSPRQRPQLVV